jgi:hypothetical protein
MTRRGSLASGVIMLQINERRFRFHQCSDQDGILDVVEDEPIQCVQMLAVVHVAAHMDAPLQKDQLL